VRPYHRRSPDDEPARRNRADAPRREARAVLLNYARRLEHADSSTRRIVAAGLGELTPLLESLWPNQVPEDLSKGTLTALAKSKDPKPARCLPRSSKLSAVSLFPVATFLDSKIFLLAWNVFLATRARASPCAKPPPRRQRSLDALGRRGSCQSRARPDAPSPLVRDPSASSIASLFC